MSKDSPRSPPGLPLEDNGLAPDPDLPVQRHGGRARLLLIPLAMATLFTGAVIGMYFQPIGLRLFFHVTGLEPGAGTDTPIAVAMQQVQSQQEVAVVSEGDVVALGRIIPRGDVISVATPSGAGDARVAEIRVAQGDTVGAGDILAVLDNLPRLQTGVATANASIRVREAALAQTRAAIRASRDEARAALERAEATARAAQLELDRATSLLERGVTTRAEFDQVAARANEAGRDVERNIATLSRYAPESDRVQADIAVAEANLAAARTELTRARQDLEGGYVRAPVAGTVLDVTVQPDERPAGGLMDLGDTSRMTVEAEVYQALIGRVAIGDPVTVSADALPRGLAGTVSAIGLEIGRQSITSDDPAANTDARVVDVIVALDGPSSEAARTLTNLEVIVRIDAGRAP
ncbi:HlyD family efflux transporter periplasmic adaptor subunit [Roseisalinus antarcticus]|uniref:Putative efflux pump membrane fusion protein n=1 Tax=Roseisalinus antarcticus TaxID=254357 RepID=A0A1Y5RIX7_9RHOB|nr:HlyD family efflux transporter periplasmic adaptor subunit [Roseisalinus antarcticus]SLN15787.1 putative efflux pump membrane fusion protein [Roseisalinus antarcticus]